MQHRHLSPAAVREGADPNAPELFLSAMTIEENAAQLAEPLPIPAPPEPPPEPELPPSDGSEVLPGTESLPPGGTL